MRTSLATPLLLLAGTKPGAALAACLFVADPSALQPLDSSRIVSVTPGGTTVITLAGCFIGAQSATVTLKGDALCEGDTIAVERQQCLVRSIQSISTGQVGQRQPPSAAPTQPVPEIAPLLRKP